jgi:hypothetical protein
MKRPKSLFRSRRRSSIASVEPDVGQMLILVNIVHERC